MCIKGSEKYNSLSESGIRLARNALKKLGQVSQSRHAFQSPARPEMPPAGRMKGGGFASPMKAQDRAALAACASAVRGFLRFARVALAALGELVVGQVPAR